MRQRIKKGHRHLVTYQYELKNLDGKATTINQSKNESRVYWLEALVLQVPSLIVILRLHPYDPHFHFVRYLYLAY